MNFRVFLIAAFCLTLIPSIAEAKRHHHRHIDRIAVHIAGNGPSCLLTNEGRSICVGSQVGHQAVNSGPRRSVWRDQFEDQILSKVAGYRPSGCPHAWCGCGTSLRVFGRIIPELNLAANWRRFPSASASAGMVAWRWGHVFYIESVNSDGTVVAYDPNSGGHVAHVHTISLRGYRVVDPHGGRYASRD